MIVNVYDKQLNPKGPIENIDSFIWYRRYYDVGEFKLLVPYSVKNNERLQKGFIIAIDKDNEIAEITYIKKYQDITGMEQIEVQGKMCTQWLNNRVMLNIIESNLSASEVIKLIVEDNFINPSDTKRKIDNLSILMNTYTKDSINYKSEEYINALLAIQALAKANDIGFKMLANFVDKAYILQIYEGKNLTATSNIIAYQTLNANEVTRSCLFAKEEDNIREQSFVHDTENFKNLGYIAGENVENRTIVTIGTASGIERKEIFINATDIKKGIENETSQLIERGNEEMRGYAETFNFQSIIEDTKNIKYKINYNVGDVVTSKNTNWGISADVRIIEIQESYESGNSEIVATFGESYPTVAEQTRKVAKQV